MILVEVAENYLDICREWPWDRTLTTTGTGRNTCDTRDEIWLTPLSLAQGHRVAPAATSVASARRSSMRK